MKYGISNTSFLVGFNFMNLLKLSYEELEAQKYKMLKVSIIRKHMLKLIYG